MTPVQGFSVIKTSVLKEPYSTGALVHLVALLDHL